MSACRRGYSDAVGSVLLLFLSSAALVLLFAALGVGVTWWALFGDKARGRRCPRCFHDLSGTPGMTCGECGFEAPTEADLHRTRRRWGLAAVSLAAILAVTGWARLEMLNATWMGQVPDAVLVQLPSILPVEATPPWVWDELMDRMAMEALGSGHVLELIRVLDPGARRIGDPDDPAVRTLAMATWNEPSDLHPRADEPLAAAEARAREHASFESERETLLAAAMPWFQVLTPLQWEPDTPPVARVRGTVWGQDTEWRIRVDEGHSPWLVGEGRSAMRMQPAFGALRLPRPDADGRVRARLVTEHRRRPGPDAPWQSWTSDVPITLDTRVEVLSPAKLIAADDAPLEIAVRGAFDHPVSIWSDDDRPAGIRFDPRPFAGAAFADLLVGVTVELCEDGAVRRRSRLWWPGGTLQRTGWEVESEDLEGLRRLRARAEDPTSLQSHPDGGQLMPGWTVRVHGDRTTALRALDASLADGTSARFWSGKLEFPLRVGERAARAPKRSFRSEPYAPSGAPMVTGREN